MKRKQPRTLWERVVYPLSARLHALQQMSHLLPSQQATEETLTLVAIKRLVQRERALVRKEMRKKLDTTPNGHRPVEAKKIKHKFYPGPLPSRREFI